MRFPLILISFLLPPIVAAQHLSPKESKDLKGSISENCFTSQRSSQINANISDAQIRFYCTCYSEELILPNTTVQDVRDAFSMMQRSGNEASLRVFLKGRNLYTIANSCSAKAIQYIK